MYAQSSYFILIITKNYKDKSEDLEKKKERTKGERRRFMMLSTLLASSFAPEFPSSLALVSALAIFQAREGNQGGPKPFWKLHRLEPQPANSL